MYSPNLGRPLATGEVPKQYVIRAPRARRTSPCLSFLRGSLLGWALLRLVASVIWTGILITATIVPFLSSENREQPSRLSFGIMALVLQLLEFGMIVTFITAGFKKSAMLYRAYYTYCILTLITYFIAVTLCFALDYENGHYFGEIYVTYHINDLPIIANDDHAFLVAAFLDVCLELFLILSIKGLIKEYSYNNNYAAGENV